SRGPWTRKTATLVLQLLRECIAKYVEFTAIFPTKKLRDDIFTELSDTIQDCLKTEHKPSEITRKLRSCSLMKFTSFLPFVDFGNYIPQYMTILDIEKYDDTIELEMPEEKEKKLFEVPVFHNNTYTMDPGVAVVSLTQVDKTYFQDAGFTCGTASEYQGATFGRATVAMYGKGSRSCYELNKGHFFSGLIQI
ncbi:16213_t:CDS:2, partial [Racocetra persica]